MDNKLRIKSRVTLIHNIRNIDISSYIPEFTPDENKIKKDTERYRIKNGIKTEATEIAEGDMVTLSCKSESPKYNKDSIVVPVGKGLFSKELEAEIIGLGINEKRAVDLDGTIVEATAVKILRTLPAEISEEDASKIRRQCIDKQLDMLFDEGEAVDGASAHVCTVIAEKSEFELDDDEINQVVSSVKQRIGEDTEDYKMFESIFVNMFKNAVIGYCYAEKNNSLFTVDDYEKNIDGYLEYNEEATREEMKKNHTLFDYTQTKYADYYIRMVDEYIKNEFKKILNP